MIVIEENASQLIDGVAAPPIEIQESVGRALGHRLTLVWLAGDRLRIEASSYIGVVDLPGDLTIRITPKVAGDGLGVLTMLGLCAGARIDEVASLTRPVSAENDLDTIELLCRLLAAEATRVLVRGTIRDYRATSDDLQFLRGRIDTRRQLLVHFNRYEQTACSFDEFDYDVAENQLLAAGLHRARALCRTATTRGRLARLIAEMDGLTSITGRRSVSARSITYDRRNSYYRPALLWATALLEGNGLNEIPPTDGLRSSTFLIDMNALFERFVEWFVAKCIDDSRQTLTTQARDYARLTVDGQNRRPLIPDVVVRWEDRRLAVDAKYKRGDVTQTAMADVYQLLIYAQTYRGFGDVPAAAIIGPTLRDEPRHSITELTLQDLGGRDSRTRIDVFGLPLAELLRGAALGSDYVLRRCADDFRAHVGLTSVTV